MVVAAPTSVTWDDPPRAELRARRRTAFSIGEAKARQRTISADAYLFLYKELVMLAGERSFCWPGLDFLVTALATSEGTLKRWMKELERADLIRRKPRPGGQTSLTYITVYLEPPMANETEDQPDDSRDHTVEAQDTGSGRASQDVSGKPEQQIPFQPCAGQPFQTPVFFPLGQ